jgi:L-seryl-tRNA(Ser) seleniumtransferase
MAAHKGEQADSAPSRQGLLKSIPKVDEFLGWLNDLEDLPDAPYLIKVNTVRQLLSGMREAILAGADLTGEDLSRPKLIPRYRQALVEKLRPNFRRVINATGVVVHTNMGRSLLPEVATDSLVQVGRHYSNLEFDLATGKRGSRYSLVEELLCDLTGAEAAMVVNNNAAAVLLVLETLAKGKEVIVSRGQLVEIGGSFRVPEVMEKSGAKLVEVGATNRTHLRDYQAAIGEETALLLKVHTSNYRMIGFTSEVELPELVALAQKYGLPVMEDLGSGSLIDLSEYGLLKEPTVGEVVKAGADVVTFSGDKMLGGPQAGLIVGKKEIVEKVKKNPMNRALRIDKFTLAGLEAVLRLYYDKEQALATIPTLAMLTSSFEKIDRRAKRLNLRIKKRLAGQCDVALVRLESRVGGGALPDQTLASRGIALAPKDRTVNDLEKALRRVPLPVIGRIEDDRLLLDMRTVGDQEIVPLAESLFQIFSNGDEG